MDIIMKDRLPWEEKFKRLERPFFLSAFHTVGISVQADFSTPAYFILTSLLFIDP